MGVLFTGAVVLPDQTGHGEYVFNPPVEIGARFGKTEQGCISVCPLTRVEGKDRWRSPNLCRSASHTGCSIRVNARMRDLCSGAALAGQYVPGPLAVA